ncbi:MAG: hypothetical protein H6R21_2517, partial [Proteobacteria bacterium]|nr:hypothetical protein [Pseudomonadota bacterium]
RAIKFWIAGTKAAALVAEDDTFRQINRRRGSGAAE